MAIPKFARPYQNTIFAFMRLISMPAFFAKSFWRARRFLTLPVGGMRSIRQRSNNLDRGKYGVPGLDDTSNKLLGVRWPDGPAGVTRTPPAVDRRPLLPPSLRFVVPRMLQHKSLQLHLSGAWMRALTRQHACGSSKTYQLLSPVPTADTEKIDNVVPIL